MKLTSLAFISSLALVAACAGSSSPDGGAQGTTGNGSGSGGGTGSTGASGSGGSSGGSSGGNSSCPLGSGCNLSAGGAGACCPAGCLDTSSDVNNCGACGLICPTGATCTSGVCSLAACAGASSDLGCTLPDSGSGECCAGACLDPNGSFESDPLNCGGCGDACATGSQCQQEQCAFADGGSGYCNVDSDCPSGQSCNFNGCQRSSCAGATSGAVCGLEATFDDTSGICCGSGCVDYLWDNQNCGGCGFACASGQVCVNGGCTPQISCGPATAGASCLVSSGHPGTCCGTSCTDTNSDSANCYGCGQACPMGGSCVEGYCQFADGGGASCATPALGCPAGTLCSESSYCIASTCSSSGGLCFLGIDSPAGICCGGSCVDPTQDPGNCGGCGLSCGSGVCVFGDVSGVCIPNGTSCDAVGGCPSGESCVGGECQETDCLTFETNPLCAASDNAPGVCCYDLDTGEFPCDDPATDPNNCGGCGIACPTGQTCAKGLCSGDVAPCGAGRAFDGCDLAGGLTGICCPGGGCVDPNSDVNNCGGCGSDYACSAGQSCVAGSCM